METQNGALEFMANRRSHSVASLAMPGPGRSSLKSILTIAARVPDHGALEPWRFIVPGSDTRAELARLARARGEALGIDPDKLAKSTHFLEKSPRLVVVVASPRESAKVPRFEQVLSAGAACLNLVNAALAQGWGAVWLTTWMADDREFATQAFGLQGDEFIAGLIHIGTATGTPPDRKRPDIDAITRWLP